MQYLGQTKNTKDQFYIALFYVAYAPVSLTPSKHAVLIFLTAVTAHNLTPASHRRRSLTHSSQNHLYTPTLPSHPSPAEKAKKIEKKILDQSPIHRAGFKLSRSLQWSAGSREAVWKSPTHPVLKPFWFLILETGPKPESNPGRTPNEQMLSGAQCGRLTLPDDMTLVSF
jgi:hypothetical protein